MLRLVIVALALAFVLAAPAEANVGRARFPGTRTTEPAGLHDVAIEHEDLRFDFRRLVDQRDANVSATYQLDNRGAATVTAPLVFVSGASTNGATRVELDGAPIRGEALGADRAAALPAAWRAPITTPAFGDGDPLTYEGDASSAVAFTLAIPPGRHQLAVTYEAVPQRTRGHEGGTLVYQLGYVLAPARDWGAFGTLDVTVEVPAGWLVAVSPALERAADSLHAQFPALPADALGISLRAPAGALHDALQIVLPLLVIAVLLAGAFALFAFGRARGRDPSDLRRLWPVSLPLSLVWALAIAISGSFAAVRATIALPAGQSGAYGYGGLFGIMLAFLGALLAIPIGLVIARAGSRHGSRASGSIAASASTPPATHTAGQPPSAHAAAASAVPSEPPAK